MTAYPSRVTVASPGSVHVARAVSACTVACMVRQLSVVASLGVAAALLVAPTQPANASGSGGFTASPGGSTGNVGTPGSGGGGTGCVNGMGMAGGQIIHTISAKCVDAETMGTAFLYNWDTRGPGTPAGATYCPFGADVYRFWGTPGGKVAGWSLSRVTFNYDDVVRCDGKSVTSILWNSAEDQAGKKRPVKSSFTPWRGAGERFQSAGDTIPDRFRDADPMFNEFSHQAVYTQNAQPYFVPGPPIIQGNVLSSSKWTECSAFAGRADDPFWEYIYGAGATAETRAQAYEYLTGQYNALRARGFSEDISLRLANLVKSGTRLVYTNTNDNCSSVLDYTVPGDATAQQTSAVGVCMVPHYRHGVTYGNWNNPSKVYASYPDFTPRRFEVLPNRLEPEWATGGPLSNAMKGIIQSQVENNAGDQFGKFGPSWRLFKDQLTFGDKNVAGLNKLKGESARAAALCSETEAGKFIPGNPVRPDCPTLVNGPCDSVTPDGPAPEGITLLLNAPKVGQVGGTTRPYTATVQQGPLLCAGGPCGSNVRLVSLTWSLSMQPSDASFRRCSSTTQLNCEYTLVQPGNSGGTAQFYNATRPGTRFVTAITNAQAKVEITETITECKTVVVPPKKSAKSTVSATAKAKKPGKGGGGGGGGKPKPGGGSGGAGGGGGGGASTPTTEEVCTTTEKKSIVPVPVTIIVNGKTSATGSLAVPVISATREN